MLGYTSLGENSSKQFKNRARQEGWHKLEDYSIRKMQLPKGSDDRCGSSLREQQIAVS